MKNTTPLENWKNRHLDGLPTPNAIINAKITTMDGDLEVICEWLPATPVTSGDDGYQGTAKAVLKSWKGCTFLAWEQNDSEFVYYQEAKF